MKEQELIDILSKAYNAKISVPEVSIVSTIEGVSNVTAKVFVTNEEVYPPTADIFTVTYYVQNRGQETESAYMSAVQNHSVIKVAAEAAAVTLTDEKVALIKG